MRWYGKNLVLSDGCYTCIAPTQKEQLMLAIRLPAEVETRLDALAKATGRTKTFYAREAILEHLDNLEDLYLAEQRLADNRAGKTRSVPLEEVMKRYGMDG
jgi:RHH-type rel operon transcriptional repressor/antitoxin RelB